MVTKKKQPAKPQPTPAPAAVSDVHVENCTFSAVIPPANEHTRDAVAAISRAAEANAHAIAEIARALKGGNATLETGMHIGPK